MNMTEMPMPYIYTYNKTEVQKSLEISEGINIDLDLNGNLIGIEIIGATQRYSLSDITRELLTVEFISEKGK